MDDIRSKSSEDLASAKQKSRDRSSSSSSLKGSRKNSEINTSSTVGVTIDDEKGVDFDSILVGQNNNKSGKDGEEGKLIHLTANRAKAPKRRPPSSHFNPGNNSREVFSKELYCIYLYLQLKRSYSNYFSTFLLKTILESNSNIFGI